MITWLPMYQTAKYSVSGDLCIIHKYKNKHQTFVLKRWCDITKMYAKVGGYKTLDEAKAAAELIL